MRDWLLTMMQALDTDDAGYASDALRAGLHAVRDRLPAAEALELGGHLPADLKELYFEDYAMSWIPTEEDGGQLIDRVRRDLAGHPGAKPAAVLAAVLCLLETHLQTVHTEEEET